MKNIGSIKLETERLFLRKFTMEDAEEMYNNWAKDPEVSKYLPWDYHESVDVTKEILGMWVPLYDEEHTYRWAVGLKATGELIGSIDVVNNHIGDQTCEVGYCYGKNYWGKGYGTEALKRVVEFLLLECDYRLVELKYVSDNPASGKVMAKAGLKYDGNLRDRAINKSNGEVNDLCYYSITKKELLESRNN